MKLDPSGASQKPCPNCGTLSVRTQSFCPKCGNKLPILPHPTEVRQKSPTIPVPPAQDAVQKSTVTTSRKVCSKCGMTSVPAQSFCPGCGTKLPELPRLKRNDANFTDSPVRCPKCRSPQVVANQRGFSSGAAVMGGILLGPMGLVGGLFGSGKTQITCLKCGCVFQPGAGE